MKLSLIRERPPKLREESLNEERVRSNAPIGLESTLAKAKYRQKLSVCTKIFLKV